MNKKLHSLVIEGGLFGAAGLALLIYSLYSYTKAFNKSWAQSPYLFPLITACALLGLSAWLIGEGIGKMRRGEENTARDPDFASKIRGVFIVLALCIIYYLALSLLKIPYITIGILSLSYTFSTFEVVTLVFLAAMMLFMGVRKPPVLILVPIGTTLFLSIAFRNLLHVLLP